MTLHRVSPSPSIRNVPEVKLGLRLTVYSQRQDSVLSQIHVGFLIAAESQIGIESNFKVRVFQEVRLEIVRFDESSVSVGRPGSWQHVEKPEGTFCVFVNEVRDDVFIFLGFFYRKEALVYAALLLLSDSFSTFF